MLENLLLEVGNNHLEGGGYIEARLFEKFRPSDRVTTTSKEVATLKRTQFPQLPLNLGVTTTSKEVATLKHGAEGWRELR
jgi:hypothetical protein